MQTIDSITNQLKRQIQSEYLNKLPSIRTLAQQFHCSVKTIQKVLELLKQQGIIESHSRSGIWKKGTRLPHFEQSQQQNSSHLYQKFLAEIQQGLQPWESPLPLIKELAVQWNCHTQTARKVLELAVQAHRIERRGRYFYLLRPKIHHKISTPIILCLGAGANDGLFRLDTDREAEFWREMGLQAAHAGISLVRQVWNGSKIFIPQGTIGIIATTWHYSDRFAICKALAKVQLPVCVWLDEAVLNATTKKYRIHYHDQGYSDENGAAMAKYILGLGHKHIAFITPWHANPWSIKRFQGIQKICKANDCLLDLHSLPGDSEWDHLIPAQKEMQSNTKFPLKTLEKLIEGDTAPLRDFMAAELGWNRIRKSMDTLFQSALYSGATAWIGANDICALNALQWLKQRNISVPRQISVVGFDDSVEALRSNLTSFRFSCASVARSIIYQILTRSKRSSLTRHKGMVVIRESSGN